MPLPPVLFPALIDAPETSLACLTQRRLPATTPIVESSTGVALRKIPLLLRLLELVLSLLVGGVAAAPLLFKMRSRGQGDPCKPRERRSPNELIIPAVPRY